MYGLIYFYVCRKKKTFDVKAYFQRQLNRFQKELREHIHKVWCLMNITGSLSVKLLWLSHMCIGQMHLCEIQLDIAEILIKLLFKTNQSTYVKCTKTYAFQESFFYLVNGPYCIIPISCRLGLWCLKPLLTIFQIYYGSQS